MDYRYVAYNQQKELVKGKVNAPTEAVALDLLSYGGLKLLSLKESKPLINKEKVNAAFYKITPREVVMFSRQLALLIDSGFDIAASLDLLEDQISNKALKRIVGDVAKDIRNGLKPSQAMAKHPMAFSSLYCRTIAVAEETGNLEKSLRQMADHIEKNANAASKVRNALIYPVIVLVLAIMVIAVLVAFVVPSFETLYTSLDTELPLVTRILLGVTDVLTGYGLYMLLGLFILVVGIFIATRSDEGKYKRDQIMLRLPLFGRIIILSELARCAATISTLFRAGVPLPEIITLCANSSTNRVVAKGLVDVRQEMLQGHGLSRPMSQNPIFLPLMVQMASVGENTGNLDNTMDTVAQSYDMEATERTTMMTSMIAPLTTLLMGGMVAFIAIALVSTMYGIMGSVGG
jgi:type IV pilus assembly protein PilC